MKLAMIRALAFGVTVSSRGRYESALGGRPGEGYAIKRN
jgi:hypothetical protein